MIYTATFFDDTGRQWGAHLHFDANDDRHAVARVLDSDPIYDENVAGWELVEASTGRAIRPIGAF